MNEMLWNLVEEALDERCDPRVDARIASALANDPEAARQLERLLRRLELLAPMESETPAAANPRFERRAAWAAAAALVLALGSGWWPRGSAPAPSASHAGQDVSLIVEHRTPEPAAGARVVLENKFVLAWTLEGETP